LENFWSLIDQCLTDKLHIEIEIKIKNQTNKLNKIRNKNKENNPTQNRKLLFHARLVNKTNVIFTKTEKHC
jgi:hypothetical protein